MNVQNHPRIVVDPALPDGRPTVRGTHFAVADVLRLLEDGDTEETLVDDFPPLTLADIRACRAYAAATGLPATRGHWIDKVAGTLDEDFARGALDGDDMSWVDRLEPFDPDAAAAALDRPGPESL